MRGKNEEWWRNLPVAGLHVGPHLAPPPRTTRSGAVHRYRRSEGKRMRTGEDRVQGCAARDASSRLSTQDHADGVAGVPAGASSSATQVQNGERRTK
jgi:hypothetical protein